MKQSLLCLKRFTDIEKASRVRELLERFDLHPMLADEDSFPGDTAGAVIVLVVPEGEEEMAEDILQGEWGPWNADSLSETYDSW